MRMSSRLTWINIVLVIFLIPCQGSAQDSIALLPRGFDSHVELVWQASDDLDAERFRIYRSFQGGMFQSLGTSTDNSFLDYVGFEDGSERSFRYFITGIDALNNEFISSDTIEVQVQARSDDELLDMVQEYTFRYFWDFAHPTSGLARERNSSGDVVTIGGSGFGIMAILVGIERGYITREEGRDRLLQIIAFLQIADTYHGVFPHWMNGKNGNTIPFSEFDDGGDLVETAFMMQGLLTAREYFDRDDPYEEAVRLGITLLWEAVEWDFYQREESGVLYWHWSPNYGWQMNFPIRGYNEALIIYLLAVASPTHGVSPNLWNTGWTASNYANGNSWYGHELFVGPSRGGPLFFAHYSYLGFDPRNKRDQFANYFEQNVNHTLINRAYCIDNPLNFEGYSEVCWGLTASDNPWGYLAHAPGSTDNGTITPTAALSSLPFTPQESMAALKHFYRDLGERLWGPMGFYDAFNIREDWFADSYLAIDQGPIVCMIENYRSELLWRMFMKNEEVISALDAIGFEEDVTSTSTVLRSFDIRAFPNPTAGKVRIIIDDELTGEINITLSDRVGKTVIRTEHSVLDNGSEVVLDLNTHGLANGLYFIEINNGSARQIVKIIKAE